MVIQWTTWEREEWEYEGRCYQVNASGVDMVPPELEDRYRQYILDVNWTQKTDEWHNKIWHLHCRLKDLNVRHLFYSGNSTFSDLFNLRDWQGHYIEPYSRDHSWNAILKNNGFEHVNPKSYHFGANGHRFWSEYVLQYLKTLPVKTVSLPRVEADDIIAYLSSTLLTKPEDRVFIVSSDKDYLQ